VQFAPEASFQDARDNIRKMGQVLGQQAKAEEMIARFNRDLARMTAPGKRPVRAALYAANGYSAGAETLAAEIMAAAGMINIAPSAGLSAGGTLPLERLVLAQPDVVIRAARYGGTSRAEEILDHPAFRALPIDADAVTGPEWVCGTPKLVHAVAAMVHLATIVAGLMVVSLLVGPAGVGPVAGIAALVDGKGALGLVMREIRLPRALLGAMVGGALGVSGAAMQGFLRNPLAEPGLIGISSSSALGAVIALQSGFAAVSVLALPGAALAGAVVAVALILMLAGPRGPSLTLILAGVAISALAGSFTSLVLNLSPNPFAVTEIVFWMLGSLSDRSMQHVAMAAPFMAVGALLLAPLGRGLDALTLGEDAAEAMGVRLTRLRLMLVLGTAALVGSAVAVAGAIGFVGLVVPHILRPFVGARPSRLLAASALGGAAMLLSADIAVRIIAPERDLKLGVLTAIIGAPFFLHLIWRTRGQIA
jgi:iron complex transport system permease protein